MYPKFRNSKAEVWGDTLTLPMWLGHIHPPVCLALLYRNSAKFNLRKHVMDQKGNVHSPPPVWTPSLQFLSVLSVKWQEYKQQRPMGKIFKGQTSLLFDWRCFLQFSRKLLCQLRTACAKILHGYLYFSRNKLYGLLTPLTRVAQGRD